MYYLNDNRNCLYVAGIEEESVVDGPGIRFTIFTQGCNHHCKGCHNPETWDYSPEALKDKVMSFEDILNKLNDNPLCSGITLSGGDPVLQAKKLCDFIKYLKDNNCNKPILMFTGYTLEELKSSDNLKIQELLTLVDSIIDGPFIQEQKSLELKFRGSRNQRYWIKDSNGEFISGD